MRTLPGLILRPYKIGKITIGGDIPTTGRSPGNPQIDTVFILYGTPLGKTVAEERIVSGRIESLQCHQQKTISKLIRDGIQGSNGTTIARSRLTSNIPTVRDIAIVYTGIPKLVAYRRKPLIELRSIRSKRKRKGGIESRGSCMPTGMMIIDITSYQGIGSNILLCYFRVSTMQTGLQYRLDTPLGSQSGIYLAIRYKTRYIKSFHQGIGCSSSLQIIG